MKCPTCGEKARTTHTRNKQDSLVVRYRECLKGHRFRTEEKPVDWLQPNLAKCKGPPLKAVKEHAVPRPQNTSAQSDSEDDGSVLLRRKAQMEAKAKDELRRILREIQEEEREDDDGFWAFADS